MILKYYTCGFEQTFTTKSLICYNESGNTSLIPHKSSNRGLSQSQARRWLSQKVYYVPLYFGVYFSIYIGYLILKVIARHKIKIPATASENFIVTNLNGELRYPSAAHYGSTKTSSLWQYPINVKNLTISYRNETKDEHKPPAPNQTKPTSLNNFNNTVLRYRQKPIKRPITEEVNYNSPYKYYFDKAIRPIEHRFHPPVKKPSSQTISPKPAESILVNQVVESPSFSVLSQPPLETIPFDPVLEQPVFTNQDQNIGYPTASYVSLRPVFFTTTELPAVPSPPKVNEEGPVTHYYPGNKLWYIALYFGFAFVVLYGYMVIEGMIRRRISYPLYRKMNNDELVDLSTRILSSIQKVAEMYDIGY